MTATLAERESATTHAVRIDGVSKSFARGAVTALDRVDLDIAPGEFVCLLGASGCGKTTLLNMVAGLDKPSGGMIELSTGRPAVMFQEAALMPWLTAARNVELPLKLAGVPRAQRRQRVTQLLELVRLGGVGDKRPHELSGGMRQRVALARALASTVDKIETGAVPNGSAAGKRASSVPNGSAAGKRASSRQDVLLLMDEPFSALDAITRDVLQAELLRVWQATGATVLFVTHDVREAVRLGQRVVLLSSRPGTVVRQWQTAELDGDAQAAVTDEINDALREVISAHAAA